MFSSGPVFSLGRIAGFLGLMLFAFARPAAANTCAPATIRGTAPADYQNYCWLDFSGYSDAQAQAGGQAFTFSLPDGSTLSLTLQVSTNKGNPALNAHAVPSWSGSAFGHSAFSGIAGNPVLYESQSGSTVQVALNNITVTPPAGSGASVSYAIIAADGESSNQGESLQFTTNGSAWAQVAQIPNGPNYPSVAGVGTQTVTETGVAGTVGSFAFASFSNPTAVGATLVGTGLQGALFAVRYASLSLNVQFNGARANAADQFDFSIKTLGGQTLASGVTVGGGTGPFTAASLATIAAGYPFVVSEAQAPGSVSPIANYALSLTCTNQAASSSTPLPVNQSVSTYTFASLQYGDSVNCLFTNTANRANLTIAKTGPATVNAAAAIKYTLLAGNTGPLAAGGALLQDPAVANFTATTVACTGVTGGAVCPSAAALTVANLEGPGIAIPTFPSGSTVTLTLSGTAGLGNIANTASIGAPPGIVNSNPTPTSTATTTVTPVADLSTVLNFAANVNAGQPVTGTLTYTNIGPSSASGMTFTLSVPANLATAPTLSGLPAGATYTYTSATGAIVLSGMPATLAAGASIGPIGVHYVQPGTGSSTVTAGVASTTLDPNPANNTASAAIGGANVADASTALTFPPHVNAGQPVAGSVLFTNNGPSTASGTTFTLSVPANLAVAPTLSGLPPGASYTYVPGTGVVTLSGMPATVNAGANVGPIGVSYVQPASAHSTVTATFATTTLDPNLSNNTASTAVTGVPVADVSVTLTFPSRVNAGQPVSGTVLYENSGPSSAAGTTFRLALPANLPSPPTLTGLPPGVSYSYAPGTGEITFTGAPTTLSASGGFGPISVSYTQPASGNSAVSATIGSSTSDPNTGNNTALRTVTGAAANLTGTVYADNNQNARFDAGDTGIPGVTVELLTGSRVIATTVTNAAGQYTFVGAAPGNFTVGVLAQKGYVGDTPSPVPVTIGGATAAVVNFGLIPGSAVGALVLTKTSPLVDVAAGQPVPYTITAKNSAATPILNTTIEDLMPPGFRFRGGSGAINGKRIDPTVAGRQLTWTHVSFAAGETKTFTLVLTPGSGVGGGDYVNQATAYNSATHGLISNLATATVRITADPTFDCPDLIGKVFDDANANGVPDPGEKGIAGVRLVTAQGLLLTTDAEGRYHVACPVIPTSELGANFLVKVDERTLPSGYRLTTDNPETVLLTAGKVSKLNFGATIHRVVRIEINDAAFDGADLRARVAERLETAVASLKDRASIVRLAYQSAGEPDPLIAARLKVLQGALTALWIRQGAPYPLRFEEDIVRTIGPPGAPPKATPP
jgi:uncharacterized repeat protein (TIGR01451 family)